MKRLFVASVVLSALTFGAAPASAFLCTQTDQGASLFWDDRTVVVRPSEHPPADVSAADVDAALAFGGAQWSAADCSDFTLELGPATADRRVGFDWRAGSGSPANVNLVVFRQEAVDDPQDEWLHAGTALAITTVTFLRSTGRIVDADIEVNDAGFTFTACDPPACTPVQDLKNTLTHELGHVLGLDHPPSFQPGAQSATMYASAPSGDLQKRDLSDDDVAGVCALYPTGEEPGFCGTQPTTPPPRIRVEKVGCASIPSSYVGAFALLLLLMGARRRRPLPRQVRVRSFATDGPERGGPASVHAICKGRCRD